MTRHSQQISVFILTAAVVAAGALVYYPYSRAAVQQRNIEAARKHAQKLTFVIFADDRFGAVRVVETARNGGTMLVVGVVETEDDLSSLRALIDNSHPDVGVTWSVETRQADPVPGVNM